MEKIISFFLIFTLLLPNFATLRADVQSTKKGKASTAFNPAKDCPEGKCVERLVGLMEAKVKSANKDKCLPPQGTKNPTAWFENAKLSVDCFNQLKEIEELQDKLHKVEVYLTNQTEKGGCTDCKTPDSPVSGLLNNIGDISESSSQLTCSPERKREISSKCGSDALCVLVSSSLIVLGPLAIKMIPSSLKAKGCSGSKDSCLTHLATGFVKSVFGLFEGLWDLLKGAGKLIKKGAVNLWNWVKGAENKSSTSQLAAAKASEDEGVFKMLLKDFGGTMSKIWSGLLASIKEWLSTSIFCQEWSGIPQFSTCKRPAQGFDCTECKAMITGMCAMSGVIVAEVIPAFLTGGIVTAAKHGAAGASKLAKLFKVSASTSKKLKNSKLASMVNESTSIIKSSKTFKATSKITKVALETLKAFMLKPAIKAAKTSVVAMKKAASASKVYVMSTPAGPFIIFGTKAAKTAGKVVIFPFENAMTVKAFQMGERTVANIISKGSGKVFNATRPAVTVQASRSLNKIDEAYQGYRSAHATGDAKSIQSATEKYLGVAKGQRGNVVQDYIKNKNDIKFSELVDELYPELNYGKFKTQISSSDVVKAEKELFQAISKVSDPEKREALTLAYQDHVTSGLRKVNMPEKLSFTKEEVYKNAGLKNEDKVALAIEITKKDVSSNQKQKIATALKNTEDINGHGVLKYKNEELTKQSQILTEAGFTPSEADDLIRSGVVGRLSPEDNYPALRKIAIPKRGELIVGHSSQEAYKKIFAAQPIERRAATSRALKVFEDAGMKTDDAAKTYSQYEKNFAHVQSLGGNESDVASFLAEYIKRQKKAGVSDELIKAKLTEAFGVCK